MILTAHTKKSFAWCLYDWANSAFAVSILSGLFPIFFKSYWAKSLASTDSTYWLGMISSVVSALIFITSPLLGQISNHSVAKIRHLKGVTYIGVIACFLFLLVPENAWLWAGLIFIVASTCFHLSHLFYDSLLPEYSAHTQDYHRNSLLGYGLGYLGGGLLFLVQSLAIQNPEAFGFTNTLSAIHFSFISTAVWWIGFSLPLFFSKPIHYFEKSEDLLSFKDFFSKLSDLFFSSSPLKWFLLSYFFYIDGIHTVYKMAVDYGLSIGLSSATMMLCLLIVQFIGFPAALGFTWASKKISQFTILRLGIAAYMLVILLATQIQTQNHFIFCAILIGVFQGSVQALSRSYFCELIPSQEEAGTYFGIYNMLGKFSAVFGPLTTGLVTAISGSHRLGLVSLSAYLIIGLILFPKRR